MLSFIGAALPFVCLVQFFFSVQSILSTTEKFSWYPPSPPPPPPPPTHTHTQVLFLLNPFFETETTTDLMTFLSNLKEFFASSEKSPGKITIKFRIFQTTISFQNIKARPPTTRILSLTGSANLAVLGLF